MIKSFLSLAKVIFAGVLSTLVSVMIVASSAQAHEVQPAVADLVYVDGRIELTLEMNLEGVLAGIDLGSVLDTNEAPQAARYDALHALTGADLAGEFTAAWPSFAKGIFLSVDGNSVPLDLAGVISPDVENPDVPRLSTVSIFADVGAEANEAAFEWAPNYGTIVLRQVGVNEPYTGYLAGGENSGPIPLGGGGALPIWQTFVSYIPTGFAHIVPMGLDHILFVLGLFFLSTRMKPLLWQVSAFTAAHTITLALASLGYVAVPGSIVEPLIAASIAYVAIENIFMKGQLTPWRPFLIFGFGLLHGLGFASVLEEFGLPQHGFVAALIGFNIGVELGQLFVIAVAFLAVGLWFGNKPWYRRVIAVPASAAIAMMGIWWVIERTIL
jgi:hypothetical protein